MQSEQNLSVQPEPDRFKDNEAESSAGPKPPPLITKPEYNYPPPPPPKHQRFEGWSSVLSTAALLLLAPLIAVCIAAFVVQSYQVDGQSMEKTLQNNDRLIVDKWPRTWARLTHHQYTPNRGNIIIFNQSGLDFAGNQSKQLIKRVIGLPGERVVVKDGKVKVYNKQFPGGFNPDKSGLYTIDATYTPSSADVNLQAGEIYVLGDNRTNSEDSRYFGPVKLDQVVGKLSVRVMPLNKIDRF